MISVALIPLVIGTVAWVLLFVLVRRRTRAAQEARRAETPTRPKIQSRRVTPRGTTSKRRR